MGRLDPVALEVKLRTEADAHGLNKKPKLSPIPVPASAHFALSSKKAQRYQGDLQFRANLQQNCRHGFYKISQTGSKASCFAVSGTYYAAVTYNTTSQWNGK